MYSLPPRIQGGERGGHSAPRAPPLLFLRTATQRDATHPASHTGVLILSRRNNSCYDKNNNRNINSINNKDSKNNILRNNIGSKVVQASAQRLGSRRWRRTAADGPGKPPGGSRLSQPPSRGAQAGKLSMYD